MCEVVVVACIKYAEKSAKAGVWCTGDLHRWVLEEGSRVESLFLILYLYTIRV